MSGRLFALRAIDIQLYRLCDDLTGIFIFPMVIFSPWAFGTTETWSVHVMNVAGYALGALLLTKLFIRHAKDYRPPRWEHFSKRSGWSSQQRDRLARLLTRTLASLTLAVLAYCVIAGWNAAATYNTETRLFEYRHYISWLPHSLDSHRTWFTFWMYLGLAVSFWAIRDWLLGMTLNEERAIHNSDENENPSQVLPERLRQLLWLLCVNGAVLGIECIVQRVSGTGKLLFLVQPPVHQEGESQFGPYAYRSNAAQYFDMLWPLCLGFWWTLHRIAAPRAKIHHLLLPCAAVMAACPIISTSRAGAIISVGTMILAAIILMLANLFLHAWRLPGKGSRWGTTGALAFFFSAALLLSWYFGWDALGPRMEEMSGGYQVREAMYDSARPMAADYPLFGTGPGTFATVFSLYRISIGTYWPEQLHNDWLETRITFGWVGMALLLAALACVFFRWLAPDGVRTGRRFVILAWLGLAGCLIYARFDYPFQIHSTLFLFLLICAVLFSMGRRASGTR